MSASIVADPHPPSRLLRPLSVDVATCLSAAAAMAHAVVTPEHFSRWVAAGVFFCVLALGQGWFAVTLFRMRASATTLSLALWANVAVIVVYVISRTSGLPFGPAHEGAHHVSSLSGRRELVGPLDALTLVAEIALVILLIAFLPPRRSRRTTSELMLVGVGLWLSSAVGLLG